MKKNYFDNRGLVKTIVLMVAGLLLMAYLGFNLRSIIESDTFIANWEFIKGIITKVWVDYLKYPLTYLIKDIFIPYIWKPGIEYISAKLSA